MKTFNRGIGFIKSNLIQSSNGIKFNIFNNLPSSTNTSINRSLSSTTLLQKNYNKILASSASQVQTSPNFTSNNSHGSNSSSPKRSLFLYGIAGGILSVGIYSSSTLFAADNNPASTSLSPSTQDKSAFDKSKAGKLNDKEFVPMRIRNISYLSHDTNMYTFAADDIPGFVPSSYVLLRYKDDDGKYVIRPYTPITSTGGELMLAIKNYPEKGKMSQHVHSLRRGDYIEMKGPLLKKKFEGNRNIIMIAGGTGITPMMQMLFTKYTYDMKTTVIYANHKPKDILFKKSLSRLEHSGLPIKVHYFVTSTDGEVNPQASVGRINKDVLKKILPPITNDTMVYVCGPPSFMNDISGPKAKDYTQGPLSGYLKELGYDETNVFKV